ncbi:MAG: TetR/AcrR family transcriptional regulator [Candidatus Cloacimonetes bacterium]|nr:TetR/AcrR family transcriptional regulator [Candidatus Cloacimonadota bacterium]
MKTKDLIVQTALKLFLSKGFNETSMNEIAVEVGISKPAIYHHFKNKDELVQAIFDHFTAKMANWTQASYSGLSDKDKIHKMFSSTPTFMHIEEVLLDSIDTDLPYSYNMFMLLMSRMKSEYKIRISEDLLLTHQKLTESFTRLQQEQNIRNDIDPETLSRMMHSILEGLSFLGELTECADVETESESLYQAFWKMIQKE